MKKALVLLLISSNFVFAQFTDINIVKEIRTKDKGLVVSAHPLASEAGAKVMKMGGNAFDAVIATQYALAVVYPQAGNIGGGGFLVGVKSNEKNLRSISGKRRQQKLRAICILTRKETQTPICLKTEDWL